MGTLRKYCERYKKILVYGIGEWSGKYRGFIQNIEAFIVSDGQKKPNALEEIPVKYLSEITVPEDYGIVLCLSEMNQKQVIHLLEKRRIKNYFVYKE